MSIDMHLKYMYQTEVCVESSALARLICGTHQPSLSLIWSYRPLQFKDQVFTVASILSALTSCLTVLELFTPVIFRIWAQ